MDSQHHHNIGKIETAGETARERRYNLVKKADAIIAIEGSIGTADIIERGMGLKKPVLPIRCTGGKSKKAWNDDEQAILQNFDLKKTSKEYKLLTANGLDNPEELSDLVIKLTKVKIAQDEAVLSSHDTPLHADNPSEEDLLGRKPFAKAIASGIRYYQKNAGKTGSFLVHIYGPWGSGKSTLLEFLKEELDPTRTKITEELDPVPTRTKITDWFNVLTKRLNRSPKYKPWIVVSFNAWQHQRVRPFISYRVLLLFLVLVTIIPPFFGYLTALLS